ncbi:MGMT family protein [Nakamurella endophytica]|nr:MGMT family protein [Nakamurella endophytica]
MALAERMLELVRAVPPGRVTTYGDIAAAAGSRSPRLAGRVLAEMSDESVPWYRVVRADGTPAPHLRDEQTGRLAEEGVRVRDGRVDLRKLRWRW